MDNNNISIGDINPTVRIANYHSCTVGQIWGPRKISDLQFIYLVKGSLTFYTNNSDAIKINQGQVICIFPGEKHSLEFTSKEDGIISGIHCELVASESWLNKDYRIAPTPPRITTPDSQKNIHDLFRICSETFNSYSKYREEQLSLITKNILLMLGETWSGKENIILSKRTQEMIQFIRDHVHDKINRQDLAKAFFMTPEHINLIFKNELGISPTQLINREKCLFAYKLLQRGDSVKEAAYQVGFTDPLYFSRVFHKTLNIAPREVR
ncbi:MAG: hypothetical protein COA79_07825 [Planctomycetota bacterium]|nr:MAG: hypothetical protein COA79_07825 [Planctomycetota bacterium]